jgi:hypothetical protein
MDVGSGPSASQTPIASHDYPPGARIVAIDESAALADVLPLLASGNEKSLGVVCLGARFSIQAAWNGLYVSARLDQGNMLRAVSTERAEWEDFKICTQNGVPDNVAFWSAAAGQYATAEFNYGGNTKGELRARGNIVEDWQVFRLVPQRFGLYNLKAYSVSWRDAPDYWVTAEFAFEGDQYGMLRARTKVRNPAQEWELFAISNY